MATFKMRTNILEFIGIILIYTFPYTPQLYATESEGVIQLGIQTKTRFRDNNLNSLSEYSNSDSAASGLVVTDPEAEYYEIVKNNELRIHAFNKMKKVHESIPALIEKCLAAECSYGFVKKALGIIADSYWNDINCVKHDNGCPQKGIWGPWGSWSECSSMYGPGIQIRCRDCDNPPPSMPSLYCNGSSFAFQTCPGNYCLVSDMRGSWGSWSSWSSCSKTCGNGIQTRTRTCKSSTPLKHHPIKLFLREVSGLLIVKKKNYTCLGSFKQFKHCNERECPVNGRWSEWNAWANCNKKCGVGVQTRSRTCSRPLPMRGGHQCSGPVTDSKTCSRKPCYESSREIVIFLGDGLLAYAATGRMIKLLHIFIRFNTASREGILLSRGSEPCQLQPCDKVELYLTEGCIELSAVIAGVKLSIKPHQNVKMNQWNTILLMMTSSGAELYFNDQYAPYKSSFPVIPNPVDFDKPMVVGKNFKGQIDSVVVNFFSMKLRTDLDKTDMHDGSFSPYMYPNVVYEITADSTSYRHLNQLLFCKCPVSAETWKIEAAVLPSSCEGHFMLMTSTAKTEILIISLDQNQILLQIMGVNDCVYIAIPIEVESEQWLHLNLEKTLTEISLSVNGGQIKFLSLESVGLEQFSCFELMIGTVEQHIQAFINKTSVTCKKKFPTKDNTYLEGVIGYFKVDGYISHIDSLPSLLVDNNRFSSNTVSHSEYYGEVELFLGQPFNLTCIYKHGDGSNLLRPPVPVDSDEHVIWLRFNQPISINKPHSKSTGIQYQVLDNGYMSILKASTYASRSDIESFYACWVRHYDIKSMGTVLFTYGVVVVDLDQDYSTNGTLMLKFIIIGSLFLYLSTATWLVVEGVLLMKRYIKLPKFLSNQLHKDGTSV